MIINRIYEHQNLLSLLLLSFLVGLRTYQHLCIYLYSPGSSPLQVLEIATSVWCTSFLFFWCSVYCLTNCRSQLTSSVDSWSPHTCWPWNTVVWMMYKRYCMKLRNLDRPKYNRFASRDWVSRLKHEHSWILKWNFE